MNQEIPYYVFLTGSKTNSGDHLIRQAFLKMAKIIRPDREFINLNGWEKFDNHKLNTVNNAKALILMGGPALRMDTYPNVYPLSDDLSKITVPIITIGIGYRDQIGTWERTKTFEFTSQTKQLFDRIENSGLISTVRCYNTLNSLLHKGYKNFRMGGCPALYNQNYIDIEFPEKREIKNIAFATGRMYLRNAEINNQQKLIIKKLAEYYSDKNFTVAFHDPINYKNEVTKLLIDFLKGEKIEFQDISSNAENLTSFYDNQDLQIGYRVHAHIYMCSVNKLSVLLSEDGRGKGMKNTIGGLIFDAYNYLEDNILNKVLVKLKLKNLIYANTNVIDDIIVNIEAEQKNFSRLKNQRNAINQFFKIHQQVLIQLP